MKALLVLPIVVAVGGAAPLPGLPSYTTGYTSWTKLNSKPIPRRAVDAHSSIKNVYVSKLRAPAAFRSARSSSRKVGSAPALPSR